MESIVMNCDCMEYMKTVPYGWFDLAVVDPEYGIDAANMTMGSGKKKKYKKSDWDKNPADEKYFKELFRISKNQIICGCNYFTLPISKGWIFWDKGINGDSSFADGELIWTSFDVVLRKADVRYKGFLGADEDRIHITQKPIRLYQWLYKNYLPTGGRVFDSHLGSGSNRIAADMAENIDFYACEIDKDYFDAQQKRFETYLKQPRIQFPEPIICEQSKLF